MQKSCKSYLNFSDIERKELFELLYLPVAFILILVLEFKIIPEMRNTHHPFASKIAFIAFLSIFGVTHILARNILSYLYNMQKAVVPFAPRATPKINVIIGSVCLMVSVIVLII